MQRQKGVPIFVKETFKMDSSRSWKKTEEVEIDIIDLLWRLWGQWKRMALCGLFLAVLAGGFDFWFGGNSEGEQPGQDHIVAENEASEETVSLTEEERERKKAEAGRLEKEIKELEEYLSHSVLMQVDPYRVDSVNLLFLIEDSTGWTVQKITESYLNFLGGAGIADALKKTDDALAGLDSSYLAELVTSVLKTNSSTYGRDEEEDLLGALLSVKVVGQDAKMAGQLALDVTALLEKHSASVKKKCGQHTLSLLSKEQGVRPDNALLTQQREKRALLAASQASWQAAVAGLGDGAEDPAAGQPDASQSAGQADPSQADGQEMTEKRSIRIAPICFGFLAGILAYGIAYALWYMLRDTVKSVGEFKAHYMIPCYGCLFADSGHAGKSWGRSAVQEARIWNRIRLSCKRQGAAKLCIVHGQELLPKEREFFENVCNALREQEIDARLVEKTDGDTPDGYTDGKMFIWDAQMQEAAAVFLACRIGETTYRMIDDEMEFFLENGVAVIGAVLLEGHRKAPRQAAGDGK